MAYPSACCDKISKLGLSANRLPLAGSQPPIRRDHVSPSLSYALVTFMVEAPSEKGMNWDAGDEKCTAHGAGNSIWVREQPSARAR